MNLGIASIFRNSTNYLFRYFTQVANLMEELQKEGHDYRLYFAEGDSVDNTYDQIHSVIYDANLPATLLRVNHGGPVFGSIDNDQRWRNISFVCNTLLDRVTEDIDWLDALIYVESDLFWMPETMLALLGHLEHESVDAVAPMCFHLPTNLFYDVWGHRKNGVRFGQFPPYHIGLLENPGALTRIDSAGSCIVMTAPVANHARFIPPELGIVGFGNNMRELGFKLWLDPNQKVLHP